MIKFLSGLFIGLLVASASAQVMLAHEKDSNILQVGKTPSGKSSIIQVDEDGYVIVRKNP